MAEHSTFDTSEDLPSIGWIDEQFAVMRWRVVGGKSVTVRLHINDLSRLPQVIDHSLRQHEEIYKVGR
jgi:hypothetical protein